MKEQHSMMTIQHHLACALLATSATLSQTFAQAPPSVAPAQSSPIIIKNVAVHTVKDDCPLFDPGFVVIEGGKITAVGNATETPTIPGAIVHDASGLHLYPGIVCIGSPIGLIETDQVRATDDRSEIGEWHPEVVASVAVNPDSALIPVSRANGIMTSVVFPQGGVLSGHASAIRMDGWTTEDLAINPELGLVIRWPATEPLRREGVRGPDRQREQSSKVIEKLNTFFDSAAAWARARESDPTTPIDLRFQSVQRAIKGEELLFIDASSTGQIESAVLWATGRGMRLVIVGGSGAEECAPLLNRHHVGVIIRGTHRLPRFPDDPYDAPFTLPARLAAAGITFAIAQSGDLGSDASNDRNLPHNAGTAVAYGLDPERAIAAITRDAALLAGVGSTLGTIEVGKSGTLILTTGNPLDVRSAVLGGWIDGRRIDLSTKQSDLENRFREKYRQLGLQN
ncbi:MAG: amidohydrolase family protein [Planctomycetota bacterium]|nr:amidohydrolase family protein [Planctomycetota bacterium]